MGFVAGLGDAFQSVDTTVNCNTLAFIKACESMLPIFDYLGRPSCDVNGTHRALSDCALPGDALSAGVQPCPSRHPAFIADLFDVQFLQAPCSTLPSPTLSRRRGPLLHSASVALCSERVCPFTF